MPDPEDREFVLTNEQWEQIAPRPPKRTKDNRVGRGRPWSDHRTLNEGIVHRFRICRPWRDVPADDDVWQTVYDRFNTCSKDGTCNTIRSELQADACGSDHLEWVVSIDSSDARAHEHAAGAQPAAALDAREDSATPQQGTRGTIELQEPAHRTRWSWTGSVPRRVDHEDPPRRRRDRATAGHPPHPRPGRGQPRTGPAAGRHRRPSPRQRCTHRPIPAGHGRGDKAYSHPSAREALRRRRIEACIPERRGTGTRCDKLAVTHLGGVVLSTVVRCWLR